MRCVRITVSNNNWMDWATEHRRFRHSVSFVPRWRKNFSSGKQQTAFYSIFHLRQIISGLLCQCFWKMRWNNQSVAIKLIINWVRLWTHFSFLSPLLLLFHSFIYLFSGLVNRICDSKCKDVWYWCIWCVAIWQSHNPSSQSMATTTIYQVKYQIHHEQNKANKQICNRIV